MKKGLVLIALAGVMWGSSCVFVNFFAPYGFDSRNMTAIRMTVSFLGLLAVCLCTDRGALRIRRAKDLLLFVGCGTSMFATAAFYYEAIRLTTASTAVVLMYLSPVPIMLFSVLFFQERFTARKGVAVGLMLVGCALVSGIIGSFKPHPLGIGMGLLSAASYTAYNLFNKLAARRGIDPFCTTVYTFLFAALCALLFGKPWELPALLAQRPGLLIPTALLHAVVTCLGPYLLYSISLKTLSVGVASSLSIIEPMSASLLGILLYKDPLTPFSLLGMLLVIASVLLLGIGEKEKK